MSDRKDRKDREFLEKTRKINAHLEELERKRPQLTPRSLPLPFVVGAASPVVLYATLYFFQPRFIQSKKDGEYARDRSKLTRWTVVLTLGVYAVFFLYACKTARPENEAT